MTGRGPARGRLVGTLTVPSHSADTVALTVDNSGSGMLSSHGSIAVLANAAWPWHPKRRTALADVT